MKLCLIYQKEDKNLKGLYSLLQKYYNVKLLKLEDYKKNKKDICDRIIVFVEKFDLELLDFLDKENPILIFSNEVNLDDSLLKLKRELLYYAYGWSALKTDKYIKQHKHIMLALAKLLINKAMGAILTGYWKEIKELWFVNNNKVNFVESIEDLRIVDLIEKIYKSDFFSSLVKILATFTKSETQMKKLSKLISRNFFPNVYEKKIFFDVSLLSLKDSGTGIHRVVKAQLNCLISSLISKFRVEPSYITLHAGILKVKYARTFMKRFLSLRENYLKDVPIVPRKGDVYYIPDYFPLINLEAHNNGFFDYLKEKGVSLVFLVYDMIPIKFPHYFPKGFSKLHEAWTEMVLKNSDAIFTISHATAEDLIIFARRKGIEIKPDRIKVIPLGAEVEMAPNQITMSDEEKKIWDKISQQSFFLMVGTLEPRKGHMQVIKAFEILWKKGVNISLVIVGKEGWKIKSLKKYIKKHKMLGKRLFWLGYVSDTLLNKLYKKALAVIVASEDEGFGLPIVEAFKHGTPVITRDIKVFREVAGSNAFFFENSSNPEVIARAVEKWLELFKENQHPKPGDISQYSWKNHCILLKKYLTEI